MPDERPWIAQVRIGATTLASLTLAVPASAATQGYAITSFDAIRVDAPINVIITTGGGASGRAEGDRDLLDRLRIEASGRVLNVTLPAQKGGERRSGTATLRLSTGDLGRVILTGGGSVAINRMKGQRAEIMLGGNGDVRVDAVDLDQLTLALTGSGRVTLTGRANTASIRVTGPGALAGEALRTRQATISNDGPGSIALTADVSAKIAASGSGSVTLAGKAACTVDNRGTGTIQCGGERY
ncbi:DUF2807 domain-containing protein [Sphingobium sp. AN558]|uniref:GIN domain-containing protein n=1 Tax=Sphingobium sp. AN558 TaxID=3133442 RepID=UPI0030BD6D0C